MVLPSPVGESVAANLTVFCCGPRPVLSFRAARRGPRCVYTLPSRIKRQARGMTVGAGWLACWLGRDRWAKTLVGRFGRLSNTRGGRSA